MKSGRRTLMVRLVQGAAAALLTCGVAGLALSSGAGAQGQDGDTTTSSPGNTNTYDLSAQANALDVVFTVPNLPLGLVVEAGPYGASSTLNSLGQSMADAGAPYSPTIYSLPGTVNGLGSGVLPPLPPLPGYVSASYPSAPTVSQSQGGYQIAATAGANDAKGAVDLGVQPAGSDDATMFASAETTANPDGSVGVSAAAGIDALSFGQLFDIGNVSSTLSMSQQANGQPVITSKTNLGSITLLGQASGLLSNGVGVLGLDTPVNVSTEVIGALNTVLSKAGIKLTYLPETFLYTDGSSSTGSSPDATKTLQAVDSGALKVSVLENVPSQGPTGAAFTLGRVYLSTTDTPGFAPSVGSGDIGAGITGDDLGAGAVTNPVTSGLLGGTGTGVVTSPVGVPGVSASASPVPPSHPLASQPAYALEKGPSAQSLYLVLILVALAVLLGTQCVRLFAVRLALSGERRT